MGGEAVVRIKDSVSLPCVRMILSDPVCLVFHISAFFGAAIEIRKTVFRRDTW